MKARGEKKKTQMRAGEIRESFLHDFSLRISKIQTQMCPTALCASRRKEKQCWFIVMDRNSLRMLHIQSPSSSCCHPHESLACGSAANRFRKFRRGQAAAQFQLGLLQRIPTGGPRLTAFLCFLFLRSHAHPSPRPQLPETEGLRLLLHR